MLRSILQVTGAGLALFAALVSMPATAQYSSDIDIYSSPASGVNAPNVLFILDNSANWNANNGQASCYYKENGVTTTSGPATNGKKFSIEQCALYNTIDALPIGPGDAPLFNIAFMLFNETNVGAGARVVKAFTPVTAAGKAALKSLVRNLPENQSPSPSSFALAMHEAYLYFAQRAPFSGQRTGMLPYDPAAFSGGRYALPASSGCGAGHIILIGNGPPQNDHTPNDSVKPMLAALGGSTAPIVYKAGDVDPKDAANWTDEYARLLAGQDVSSGSTALNVTTYAVAVTGASSDKSTYPNIFRGIARAGGGDFYQAVSADDLTLALGRIFNQMQAVNSVFSSASLPVSVNARGTYLNQVFMGMFRPDAQGKPRWRGNLKQYQFAYDPTTDSLYLSDAANRPAVSGTTGFITPDATSFWSRGSSFWANQKMGTPASESDSPDGEIVEKGGIAQGIRTAHAPGQDGRKLYTCIGCASNTNLAIDPNSHFVVNTPVLTAAMLGVSNATARAELIAWVRGQDNAGDEHGPGGATTIRPSVHGDILHSRPAVVNYGGATGIVVFYGANDGMLRAVNGNQTGINAGQELWGFLPQEHLGKLGRLRANAPEVRLSTTQVAATAGPGSPTPRDYFVDGPIGIYQKVGTNGANERVILYSAMRRGGRLLYALDVTDPTQPRFLWKKSDADLPVLGQTWSEPKVARVKGHSNPVIIMGAGYDSAAEDQSPQGVTTMGNAVLVLDALTGTLLSQFNTVRSVAADVSLIDADHDGYVDRVYAVDLGGHVYRIDLERGASSARSDWGSYQVASLAGSGTRKFFHAPDVVLARDFAALLVGSGDREKPLATTSTDAFFTLYDTRTAKGTPSPAPVPIQAGDLGRVGTDEAKAAGCFISMDTAGEKVVNAPVTVAGITYFSTNKPAPTAAGTCRANLGEARMYSAPLFCKAPATQRLNGGGLPPSPVTGVVTVSYPSPHTGLPVTKQVPFIIGAPNAKGSGIEGSKVSQTVAPVRKRRYWILENAR